MYSHPPSQGGRPPPAPPGARPPGSPQYLTAQIETARRLQAAGVPSLQHAMAGTRSEEYMHHRHQLDLQHRMQENMARMERTAVLQAAVARGGFPASAWQQHQQQFAEDEQHRWRSQQVLAAAGRGNALYGSFTDPAVAMSAQHHLVATRKADPPASGDADGSHWADAPGEPTLQYYNNNIPQEQPQQPQPDLMEILAAVAGRAQETEQQHQQPTTVTRRGRSAAADPADSIKPEEPRKMRPRKRKGASHKPPAPAKRRRGAKKPVAAVAALAPATIKRRKKKPSNQPKNPLGAFVFFQKKTMPTVFEENSCITFGEAAATCGRLWKELSEENKKPFTDMAKQDKQRYIRELEEYRSSLVNVDAGRAGQPPTATKSTTTTPKSKKPRTSSSAAPKNEPKKPRNAFTFYKAETMTEIFREFPLITFGEAATECAARFKLISKEEKQAYRALAAQDKVRYLREQGELQQKQDSSSTLVEEKKTSKTSADGAEGSEKPDDCEMATEEADPEEEADDELARLEEAVLLANLPKYSELTDPNEYYVEEQAWRYHNPPLPPSPVRKKEKAPEPKYIPPDSFVAPEDLRPLPPAPPLPETFPNTGYCRWSFNEDLRILYADFRRADGIVVTPEDEEFLLKMFERDDITVVSEGLMSGLDKDKWTLDYISRVAGDEYYHKFRRFDRDTTTQAADAEPSRKPAARNKKPTTKKAGKVPDADGMDGTVAIAEGATEPIAESFVDVRHVEIDRCLSMKVSDYINYLKRRKACLQAGREAESFTFSDHLGVDHTIDVIDSVLYMIDYDMVKLLPTMYADFLACWKIPGILPGGSHCMMNSVNVNGRPFMGPNVYITPPASFTHFHQDGHGTVDSGHFCVSGFNEVIMLRRMTERHKRHALRLLTGGDRTGSTHVFEALYNLPHGDGLGEKPRWPDFSAIDKCKAMNYYPSVFILKPGQHCHISKGRLHAFRKLAHRPLPPNDCHSKLRAEVVGTSTGEKLCVSVAWDWMYRGVTSQGMNREIVTSLECAALNRRYGVQSLAIPELSLLQMARTLVPEEGESEKTGDGKECVIAFEDESKATNALTGFHPAPDMVCRGIFPALQYVIKQQMHSIKSAESKESRSSERCKRVSIAKRPNSWENPLSTTVDPYGESDFFCKLCHKELSNSYYHCDGCELILSKDFNICIECHTEKRYMVQVDMHPLNSKRHSTINHIGNMNYDRASRCPCKNGPICRHCSYCAGCSCRCHTWFTLSSRFLTKHGLLELLSRVRKAVGFAELEAADEVQKRLSMAVNGFVEESDRVIVETDEVGEDENCDYDDEGPGVQQLFGEGGKWALMGEPIKKEESGAAEIADGNMDVEMAETKSEGKREHIRVVIDEKRTVGISSEKHAVVDIRTRSRKSLGSEAETKLRSGTWTRDERQKLQRALEAGGSWSTIETSVPSRPADEIRKFAESNYLDLVDSMNKRSGEKEASLAGQRNNEDSPSPTSSPQVPVAKEVKEVVVKDLQVVIKFSKAPAEGADGPQTRRSGRRKTTVAAGNSEPSKAAALRSRTSPDSSKDLNVTAAMGRFDDADEENTETHYQSPPIESDAVCEEELGEYVVDVEADAVVDTKEKEGSDAVDDEKEDAAAVGDEKEVKEESNLVGDAKEEEEAAGGGKEKDVGVDGPEKVDLLQQKEDGSGEPTVKSDKETVGTMQTSEKTDEAQNFPPQVNGVKADPEMDAEPVKSSGEVGGNNETVVPTPTQHEVPAKSARRARPRQTRSSHVDGKAAPGQVEEPKTRTRPRRSSSSSARSLEGSNGSPKKVSRRRTRR